jgi:hypothetical protein
MDNRRVFSNNNRSFNPNRGGQDRFNRNNNNDGGHKRIHWNQVEDFTENGITVRVNQAQYRYSIIIGRKDFNDRFRIIPFIPTPVVGLQDKSAVLQFDLDYAQTVANLVRKAQDFILQRENRYRDENPQDNDDVCDCTDDCPDTCDCDCHFDDEEEDVDEAPVSANTTPPRRVRMARV